MGIVFGIDEAGAVWYRGRTPQLARHPDSRWRLAREMEHGDPRRGVVEDLARYYQSVGHAPPELDPDDPLAYQWDENLTRHERFQRLAAQ